MYSIHICLVSEQSIPNLLPVFSSQCRVDKVIYICSGYFKANGKVEALSQIIKSQKVDVQVYDLKDAYSKPEVEALVEQIIDENNGEETSISLNVTGGTKLMSLAAYEVCYSLGKPIYYVDKNILRWLYNAPAPDLDTEQLDGKLTINQILNSYSVDVIQKNRKKVSDRSQFLINKLINNHQNNPTLIKTLNYHAMLAKKTPDLSSTINDKEWGNPMFRGLLEHLEHDGLLERLSKNRIRFNSEESRFFLNGGWLEDYVFFVLQQIQTSNPELINDVARSVEIQFKDKMTKQSTKNELDVVFVKDNQLFIIECKTKIIPKNPSNKQDGETQAMIYKLGSLLKSLGGIIYHRRSYFSF